MQKLLNGVIGFVCAMSIIPQMLAQTAGPAAGEPATYFSAAEMQTLALKQPATMPLSDQLVGVVNINGEYNIGEAMVHRAKPSSAPLPQGMTHNSVAEIYIMLTGNATFVAGGTMDNPRDLGNDGRTGQTFSSRDIKGGESFEMGPGDVVIVPPNTPHYFSAIQTDEITYITDRIDPARVMSMPGQPVTKSPDPTSAPGPAVAIKAAEIQAAAEATGRGIVQMLRLVPINNGQYNIGVALLHRSPKAADMIQAHSQITEIYHFISGKAMYDTGGTMQNAKVDPPNPRTGPSFTGTAVKGAVSREVGPGDLVIIPPNTVHYFSKVESDQIVYLVVRIDPHHVLAMPAADSAAAK